MIIARITDSYSYGTILYTVHEDCITEGTSSRIIYNYGGGSVTEACGGWGQIKYRYDGRCVTDLNNRILYYIEDDTITDSNRRILAYIKREVERNTDTYGSTDNISSTGYSSTNNTHVNYDNGEGGIIGFLIILAIYAIIIGFVAAGLDVPYFGAFFGAPVLIAIIWFFANIFG